MDLPDPPEGWRLKYLNDNNDMPLADNKGTWTVCLYTDEETIIARGTSPRYAMLAAIDKAERGEGYPRVAVRYNEPPVDLVALLGIGKPKVDRRG